MGEVILESIYGRRVEKVKEILLEWLQDKNDKLGREIHADVMAKFMVLCDSYGRGDALAGIILQGVCRNGRNMERFLRRIHSILERAGLDGLPEVPKKINHVTVFTFWADVMERLDKELGGKIREVLK